MNKHVRILVGIIALLTCVFIFLSRASKRYKDTLFAASDVCAALIYYMEDNKGQWPMSEVEFLSQPYMIKQPDGSVCVERRPQSTHAHKVYGQRIVDVGRYAIPWGTRMSELVVDGEGNAWLAEKRVLLMHCDDGADAERTRCLIIASRELRGGQKSQ